MRHYYFITSASETSVHYFVPDTELIPYSLFHGPFGPLVHPQLLLFPCRKSFKLTTVSLPQVHEHLMRLLGERPSPSCIDP